MKQEKSWKTFFRENEGVGKNFFEKKRLEGDNVSTDTRKPRKMGTFS